MSVQRQEPAEGPQRPPSTAEEARRNPGVLRWFYLHAATNTLFWTCTLGGSLFALYMRNLGLEPGRIGILMSLFPFMQVLSLGTGALVERIGHRKAFLWFYGSRKLTVMALATTPWLLGWLGTGWTFAFVVACLILFGVQRSVGETGYYPWLKEFIPDEIRGRTQGTAMIFGALSAGAGTLLAGWLVANRNRLELGRLGAFQCSYFLFALLGLVGVLGARRLPGGRPPMQRPKRPGFARRLANGLRDRRLVTFLIAAGILEGSVMLFAGLMPLYMRDVVGLSEAHVVRLTFARMVGALAAGLLAGRVADRCGSRPVLFALLISLALMPILWMFLPDLGTARVVGAYAAYLLFGIALSGAVLAALQLMYNTVVSEENKNEYLALRYAVTGLVGGTIPLLAGQSVELFSGLDGRWMGLPLSAYLPLFALSALAWIVSAMLFGRIRDTIPRTNSPKSH